MSQATYNPVRAKDAGYPVLRRKYANNKKRQKFKSGLKILVLAALASIFVAKALAPPTREQMVRSYMRDSTEAIDYAQAERLIDRGIREKLESLAGVGSEIPKEFLQGIRIFYGNNEETEQMLENFHAQSATTRNRIEVMARYEIARTQSDQEIQRLIEKFYFEQLAEEQALNAGR